MVEKKVYSGWAFTADEKEKRDTNNTIYKELCSKYKVKRWSLWSTVSLDSLKKEYDFIYEQVGHRYGTVTYHIIKAPENMTLDERALVLDEGNLCFGYYCSPASQDYIEINTD